MRCTAVVTTLIVGAIKVSATLISTTAAALVGVVAHGQLSTTADPP